MQAFGQLLKKLTSYLPTAIQSADGDCSRWMGKLASAEGQIDWKRSDNEDWAPMKPGDAFYPRDAIRAGHGSQAVILFYCPGHGNYLANLYENSILTFTPEVLQKYFEDRPSLEDELQPEDLDPRVVANTQKVPGRQG